MDIKKKLLSKQPAKEPLTSLAAIVRDWRGRFVEGEAARLRDEVVDYCRDAASLEDAIRRACQARRPNGKMHNHQTRVPDAVRQAYAWSLLGAVDEHMNSFEQLHLVCESVAELLPGIGEVTVYDVATRIAAYLKLEPEQLHLHAGVMEGWLALNPDWDKRHNPVARAYWPEELRELPADQVEDLLCTYREQLKEIGHG